MPRRDESEKAEEGTVRTNDGGSEIGQVGVAWSGSGGGHAAKGVGRRKGGQRWTGSYKACQETTRSLHVLSTDQFQSNHWSYEIGPSSADNMGEKRLLERFLFLVHHVLIPRLVDASC